MNKSQALVVQLNGKSDFLPVIIITTQCFEPKIGGIEALMTGMAESMASQGKDVLVLADGKDSLDDKTTKYAIKRFRGWKPLRRLRKAAYLEKVCKEQSECRSVVMASLIWSTGSIPMSQRAKLIVLENGEMEGTIGGGCLEAEIYEHCQSVLITGKPQRFRYTMTEKQAGEDGLNCGGTVEIFIEKILKKC